MISGAFGRVEVAAAGGTRPRLTALRRLVPLERTHLLALRALRMLAVFGVAGAPEVVEARVVVGEPANELHEGDTRVRRLRTRRSDGLLPIGLRWEREGNRVKSDESASRAGE